MVQGRHRHNLTGSFLPKKEYIPTGDVYKRQGLSFWSEYGCHISAKQHKYRNRECERESTIPVSYTQLDVYKRQEATASLPCEIP